MEAPIITTATEVPKADESHVVVMEPQVDLDDITPDKVRGLSLGRLTETYGTYGLYVRMNDTLEQKGLLDNEMVQNAFQLGLTLHAQDFRSTGDHYTSHLMRVTLRMMEDFGINDPDLIAAGSLHDSIEDHPRDLVLALSGEKPEDVIEARKLGRQILAQFTNDDVAEIVWAVTNPLVEPGQNKLDTYTIHTADIVFSDNPKPRILKLSDFIDNAVGNHITVIGKRRKLDEKYIHQYRVHRFGLTQPNSLITGQERLNAYGLLNKGMFRAMARLGLKQMPSPQELLSPENATNSHTYFR